VEAAADLGAVSVEDKAGVVGGGVCWSRGEGEGCSFEVEVDTDGGVLEVDGAGDGGVGEVEGVVDAGAGSIETVFEDGVWEGEGGAGCVREDNFLKEKAVFELERGSEGGVCEIKRACDVGVAEAEAFGREGLFGMKKQPDKNPRADCCPGCGIFNVFGRVEDVEDCGMSFMGVFNDESFICREIIRKFRFWPRCCHAHPLLVFYFPS